MGFFSVAIGYVKLRETKPQIGHAAMPGIPVDPPINWAYVTSQPKPWIQTSRNELGSSNRPVPLENWKSLKILKSLWKRSDMSNQHPGTWMEATSLMEHVEHGRILLAVMMWYVFTHLDVSSMVNWTWSGYRDLQDGAPSYMLVYNPINYVYSTLYFIVIGVVLTNLAIINQL